MKRSHAPVRGAFASPPWVTACVAAALVASSLGFCPHIGSGGDNAEYLALARSMVEGRGYRMIAEPEEPIDTKRWPGYPVLLAGLMGCFGERLWAPKAAQMLAFAATAGLGCALITRSAQAAGWMAAAGVSVFILNEDAVRYASTLYAEMPFALLGVAALLLLGWAAETPSGGWGSALAAGALIAASIYVRPNGIALIPAAFVFLALRKRWKQALIVCGLAALLVLPWVWREARATARGGHTYASKALGHTEEDAPGAWGLEKWTYRIGRNAAAQALSLGQMVIARPRHLAFLPVIERQPAPGMTEDDADAEPVANKTASGRGGGVDMGHLSRYLLAAVVLVGGVVTWRGTGSSIHWYVIFTILMLLLIPWPRGRYLFPLLPFFGWFLVEGIMWLAGLTERWLGEGRAHRLGVAGVLAAVGLALILTSMAVSQQFIMNVRNRGLPYWAPERYAHQGMDLANYMGAVSWIRDNTPVDAVVACRKPYQVYWVSGRKSTMVWAQSAEGAWRGFEDLAQHGPVYVIEDAFGERYDRRAQARTWWGPALRCQEGREAHVVFETAIPEVRVWSVQPVEQARRNDIRSFGVRRSISATFVIL